MQISIITTGFSPFWDSTTQAKERAFLADALVSLGHTVRVVVPLPKGLALDTYSLARRLNPIQSELNGNALKAIRYDGRTSSGVESHLLEIEGPAFDGQQDSSHYAEAFCHLAISCLDSLSEPIDCCLSFESALLFPMCAKKNPLGLSKTIQMLVVDTLEIDPAMLAQGVEAADRIIIAGRNLAEEACTKGIGPLEQRLAQGSAFTLQKPCQPGDSVSSKDKATAKTTFQADSTLEVRSDVPLVLFTNSQDAPFDETLKHFLEGDVQAVCAGSSDELKNLAEQYPDRLCLAPSSESLQPLLAAADGCVVGQDPDMTAMALSNGTVPIAGPGASSELVDLEPSCESGSGIIVADLTTKALAEGLGRFLAAFHQGPDFLSLTKRLPEYVPSWSKTAQHYIQLIDELKPTEK